MGRHRHIALYTSPYPWSRSLVLVPGCTGLLAEISAELQEVVAHLRRVRDDALYKSTVTLQTKKACSVMVRTRRRRRWWAYIAVSCRWLIAAGDWRRSTTEWGESLRRWTSRNVALLLSPAAAAISYVIARSPSTPSTVLHNLFFYGRFNVINVIDYVSLTNTSLTSALYKSFTYLLTYLLNRLVPAVDSTRVFKLACHGEHETHELSFVRWAFNAYGLVSLIFLYNSLLTTDQRSNKQTKL